MPIEPHWDTLTCVLYLSQALLGAWCFSKAYTSKSGFQDSAILTNRYVLLWGIVWVFFASFRTFSLTLGGGRDTMNYVAYFDFCSGEVPYPYCGLDNDPFYAIFNRIIRLFTDNYHVYFLMLYCTMFVSQILFLETFCPSLTSYSPFILTFYLWLRGYMSIRSNLGIALIMLSMVFLFKRKTVLSILFAVFSALCHKMCVVYALYLPFYLVFCQKKALSVTAGVVLTTICILCTNLAKEVFLFVSNYIKSIERYQRYALENAGSSFFDNFWKICFEQMLLAAAMLVLYKKTRLHMQNISQQDRDRLQFIWNICIFDFILIPIAYTFTLWRCYEFMYLPRLIMWGVLIYVFQQELPEKLRKPVEVTAVFAFVSWFVFRIYNTYEDSKLMPYILDFILPSTRFFE